MLERSSIAALLYRTWAAGLRLVPDEVPGASASGFRVTRVFGGADKAEQAAVLVEIRRDHHALAAELRRRLAWHARQLLVQPEPGAFDPLEERLPVPAARQHQAA